MYFPDFAIGRHFRGLPTGIHFGHRSSYRCTHRSPVFLQVYTSVTSLPTGVHIGHRSSCSIHIGHRSSYRYAHRSPVFPQLSWTLFARRRRRRKLFEHYQSEVLHIDRDNITYKRCTDRLENDSLACTSLSTQRKAKAGENPR